MNEYEKFFAVESSLGPTKGPFHTSRAIFIMFGTGIACPVDMKGAVRNTMAASIAYGNLLCITPKSQHLHQSSACQKKSLAKNG